jgi:hypothetical protein
MEKLEKVLPIILTITFGIGCGVASGDPVKGVALLATISAVVTLPYFVVLFVQAFAGGQIVIGCLLAIGLAIPIVNLLVLAWILVATLAKFHGFLRNVPLILVGFLLYVGVATLPPMIVSTGLLTGVPNVISFIVIGVIGAALFWLLLRVGVKLDYQPALASSLMLGFGCYVVLFAISLFLPGDAGIDINGGTHA